MVRHAAPACAQPLSASYLGGGPFIWGVFQRKQSNAKKVPAAPHDEARRHCQITLNNDLHFLSVTVTECASWLKSTTEAGKHRGTGGSSIIEFLLVLITPTGWAVLTSLKNLFSFWWTFITFKPMPKVFTDCWWGWSLADKSHCNWRNSKGFNPVSGDIPMLYYYKGCTLPLVGL